jgi:4-hydroxy-3-methylbut-2-enyl diphosphate reductase
MDKKPLTIVLAAPRGFCAGVDRAIQIVEMALEKYGPPVYVRHEIVHNKFVVDSLKAKGAVFVEELDEIPPDQDGDQRPVIFSAHGVPKSVPEAAKGRAMFYIDATCPLVSKVHKEAERYFAKGCQIILVGHAGHPEVIGTMGQLPKGAVILVETLKDVATLRDGEDDQMIGGSDDQDLSLFDHPIIRSSDHLAYCTQTTLSVDDTAEIVDALKALYPNIQGPHKEDICYATTNRQAAVKRIAPECAAMIVIGAPNSSNSNRLVEVAVLHGCAKAMLVQRASEIDWGWMEGVAALGITAGASAPEILVDEVIAAAKERFDVTIREIAITQENVNFKVPRVLTEDAA